MTIDEIRVWLIAMAVPEEIPTDIAEAILALLDDYERLRDLHARDIERRRKGGRRRQELHGPPPPEQQAKATKAATLARVAAAKARREAREAEAAAKPYPDGDEPI